MSPLSSLIQKLISSKCVVNHLGLECLDGMAPVKLRSFMIFKIYVSQTNMLRKE